jgi:accessory gene regulator protein AgrB
MKTKQKIACMILALLYTILADFIVGIIDVSSSLLINIILTVLIMLAMYIPSLLIINKKI